MMKKFVADTYFEAMLKARNELGEDAEVVTSRTFKDSTWGGFYAKEMVEVTAMAPKPRPAGRPARQAPLRPVPAEELAVPTMIPVDPFPPAPLPPPPPRPRPTATTSRSRPTTGQPPIKGPPPAGYAPPRPHPHLGCPTARQAHTIRTIQMGDEDPLPQAVPPDQVGENAQDDRITRLLEAILVTKQTRQGAGAPLSSFIDAPELRNHRSIHSLEQKLGEICCLLTEMQKSTTQALQATPSLPPGLDFLRQRLEAVELPQHVLGDLMACFLRDFPAAAQRDPVAAREEFTRCLRKKLRFGSGPGPSASRQPCFNILLGPTGVGKTTTIAKLAATYALNVVEGKSVALVTTDTFRIGATGQLAQFSQIMGAEFEIAYAPDDIPALIQKHQARDVILVDTAGRCQKQEKELEELKRFVERFPSPTKYLVLSATTKYSDMIENVRQFGNVGFDHLIFTKVDETNSVGPLLALLFETSGSLAYITDGQSVPDDFRPADLDFFLQRIFEPG